MPVLFDRMMQGDIRAAARLMRLVDDRTPGYIDEMRLVWQHAGKAHIIGITGAPGAGKSTLTDSLISAFRKMNLTVGVVAVDPSSPFSGGAILGDRIRMSDHCLDDGVFIRSVATRGHLGGLSVSAMDIAAVMDAMGKDIVIIETVGVGQDEVEIATVADSCIVVTVPGMGDDIQAIKAGILEIADIFVVNKADRDGVDRTINDLKMMLNLTPIKKDALIPPIIKTVAVRQEGIQELVSALQEHRENITAEMKNKKLEDRLIYVTQGIIKEKIFTEIFPTVKLKSALKTSANDPYGAMLMLWDLN